MIRTGGKREGLRGIRKFIRGKLRKRTPPKLVKHVDDGDSNCSWFVWKLPERVWEGNWNSWKSVKNRHYSD